MVIIDFSQNTDLTEWYVVNDIVMGGKSRSTLTIDTNGNCLFSGTVSLENNGGFCSLRHEFKKIDTKGFKNIAFRVKGDGKRYQVRIRADKNDYYSYIAYFSTSGKWQTIEIPLKEMYPSFRGRRLNNPNFEGDSFVEMSFLIGNKKAENFQLLIDRVMLK